MKDQLSHDFLEPSEADKRYEEAMAALARQERRREAQGAAVGLLFDGMQSMAASRGLGSLIKLIPWALAASAVYIAAAALGLVG